MTKWVLLSLTIVLIKLTQCQLGIPFFGNSQQPPSFQFPFPYPGFQQNNQNFGSYHPQQNPWNNQNNNFKPQGSPNPQNSMQSTNELSNNQNQPSAQSITTTTVLPTIPVQLETGTTEEVPSAVDRRISISS